MSAKSLLFVGAEQTSKEIACGMVEVRRKLESAFYYRSEYLGTGAPEERTMAIQHLS